MLKGKTKAVPKPEGSSVSPDKKEHKPSQSIPAEDLELILKAPNFSVELSPAKTAGEQPTPPMQLLFQSIFPLPTADEHLLQKAKSLLLHPHRFVRRVLSVDRQPTVKSGTIFLAELPADPLSLLAAKPLMQKVRIAIQLTEVLIHLHKLKQLLLDFHEGYLSFREEPCEICVDCFYKHSLKEDAAEWNRIRAPELVNDRIIGNGNALHDYSSADVWSLANFLIGILWDPSARITYSTQDSSHKYFVMAQTANQLKIELVLPDLKIPNSTQLVQLLEKCLYFDPKQRASLQALRQCLDRASQPPQPPYESFEKLLEDVNAIKQTQLTPRHFEPTLISKDITDFIAPVVEHLVKGRKSRFDLVYRASACQFRADAFHHYCDKLTNLLVLCRASNGKSFGGFSSASWEGKNGLFGCYRTSNTILFSISNRTIHRLKTKDQAIGCQPSLGPVFGTADLVLGDCNISNVCMFPLAYKPDEPDHRTTDSTSLAGGSTFSLEEYEVYAVKVQL